MNAETEQDKVKAYLREHWREIKSAITDAHGRLRWDEPRDGGMPLFFWHHARFYAAIDPTPEHLATAGLSDWARDIGLSEPTSPEAGTYLDCLRDAAKRMTGECGLDPEAGAEYWSKRIESAPEDAEIHANDYDPLEGMEEWLDGHDDTDAE